MVNFDLHCFSDVIIHQVTIPKYALVYMLCFNFILGLKFYFSWFLGMVLYDL